MPDIKPKDVPQPTRTERVEFSKSAKIAVTKLNDEYQRGLSEIVQAVAEDRDLKPQDGWQFDPKTLAFTRTV